MKKKIRIYFYGRTGEIYTFHISDQIFLEPEDTIGEIILLFR